MGGYPPGVTGAELFFFLTDPTPEQTARIITDSLYDDHMKPRSVKGVLVMPDVTAFAVALNSEFGLSLDARHFTYLLRRQDAIDYVTRRVTAKEKS